MLSIKYKVKLLVFSVYFVLGGVLIDKYLLTDPYLYLNIDKVSDWIIKVLFLFVNKQVIRLFKSGLQPSYSNSLILIPLMFVFSSSINYEFMNAQIVSKKYKYKVVANIEYFENYGVLGTEKGYP